MNGKPVAEIGLSALRESLRLDGRDVRFTVLRGQLARMLGDAKIQRFTAAFPKQWLQLHRVGQFPADPVLYPDYDKWLEESMVLETTLYFDAVFKENLSLREFLASDWTMLSKGASMAGSGNGSTGSSCSPRTWRGARLVARTPRERESSWGAAPGCRRRAPSHVHARGSPRT